MTDYNHAKATCREPLNLNNVILLYVGDNYRMTAVPGDC